MRGVELFSGCGGLSMGLSRAGFGHELMIEWNRDAVATVLHNQALGIDHVAHWPVRQADVRTVDFAQFRGELEIVAGGPPCQPFSLGGKARGHEDERDMWPSAIRSVREAMPKTFLFENVKGLARPAFADYLEWITRSLERASHTRDGVPYAIALDGLRGSSAPKDYEVIVLKVNAADYGAPQHRHRVLVAGVRSDLGIIPVHPKPTHSRERLLWDQWCSGIYWEMHGLPQPSDDLIAKADLRTVQALRNSGKAPDGLPWVTLRDAIRGLGEPTGVNNHVFQPGAKAYPGHTGSPLDQPAKALKAGAHGVPGGENMMVRDDGTVRYFTLREAARLQGLPDDYEFPRSWSESMRQLGNAVPAQLGEALGLWLAHMLRSAPGAVKDAA
jgi:DNA (cytosine-5)-methyltransferase 1